MSPGRESLREARRRDVPPDRSTAKLRLLWLGAPMRFGRWPHSRFYRLLFDLGPIRLAVRR